MAGLAFISSLVSSVAWPAAVALGLIFRKPLTAMFANLAERMNYLTHLRAPGTEFSFRDSEDADAPGGV